MTTHRPARASIPRALQPRHLGGRDHYTYADCRREGLKPRHLPASMPRTQPPLPPLRSIHPAAARAYIPFSKRRMALVSGMTSAEPI